MGHIYTLHNCLIVIAVVLLRIFNLIFLITLTNHNRVDQAQAIVDFCNSRGHGGTVLVKCIWLY